MNTVKIDKYFRGMIAHRGLSGIETENTLSAFVAAANRSYFGIECDIRASKDNKLIVTHDDTLLRLGLLNLYIPSFKYDELKKFTLVDRKTGNLSDQATIPLLVDYLDICRTYQKIAFIEAKHGLENEHLDQLLSQIESRYDLENVVVISFEQNYLSYLRKKRPEMTLFLLADELNEKRFEFCEKNRIHLDIDHKALDESIVKRFHLLNLKVAVYTVDDKDVAERLIKLGVDYITTNILE
ncbi:MAG: glycerophosphodiester phosphodiesterase family protein [Candidatus Izemoplasmatales bacterium]|nr:glycerophosphodiester phosphodiesterase family protein [Candidatus Izemoplasmatales bacterium]